MRGSRPSIPRRIALGFALVLCGSGAVSIVSFVQHDRTGRALTLLDDGYLPLALTVSEARATQQVIINMLDRLLSERDPSGSRAWLQAARKERPQVLKGARAKATQIHGMVPWETEGSALVRLRRELRKLQTLITKGESRYVDLYAALDKGDRVSAGRILADVRARERAIDNEWERIWSEIVARIDATSQRVGAQQRQALIVLGVLAGVSLLVGVIVAWWAQRVLQPLPRLQERVEAVARGELVEQLGPTTDDEIGRLANEFERMVKALVAREESLGETQSRLIQSERLAAIGRMAAHVSHEVRNPLSSIGLNVELLEEGLTGADRETRDLLGAIHREIDRLRAVTEEYLRLARLPNPHLAPEYMPDVVRGAVQLLRPELEAAGVELDLQLAEDLPLVALDEAQIRQVLINLLKNAREAMPKGGRIELAVRACVGGVELTVRDQGVGMDGEQKERIFDLFYTTKQRGSGLGLPLTQQIVVAHRGHIRCESSPGRGTTFTLFFPAAKSERAGQDAMVAEE
ncbi:MAG TPA: ATP-binding protein [Polyangiales bacterium]|nr:ATP-binding protein [Polyangiales bacterium]